MNKKLDLVKLRREYGGRSLKENSVSKNPLSQLKKWIHEAIESDIYEPNAMCLSTTSNGRPASRIVLLRKLDKNGLFFYTNYKSHKGEELKKNPYATAVFYWQELHRQIRITGKVKKVSPKESEKYFKSRPRDAQISALASDQSAIIKDRKILEEKIKFLTKKFEGQDIPRPKHWGGYQIIPDCFEFWQGRESRLHDRICYKKKNGGWKIFRLSP